METMTPLEVPSEFFSDGQKLRLGSSIIQEYFAVIGMSGTAVGSMADVFRTLSDLTDTVDSIPPRYRGAMLGPVVDC